MGIAFLGTGFDPKWRFEDVPRMPKSRWGPALAGVVVEGMSSLWAACRSVQGVRASAQLARRLQQAPALMPAACGAAGTWLAPLPGITRVGACPSLAFDAPKVNVSAYQPLTD